MMFDAEFHAEMIDLAVESLDAETGRELFHAIFRIEELIAASARAQHGYTNRTGSLEHLTLPGDTWRESDGNIGGTVVGDTEYGSYVEDLHDGQYAYLFPAFERTDARQSNELDRHLVLAIRGARGWSNG